VNLDHSMTKMSLQYCMYVVLYQISAHVTFADYGKGNAITCNENKKHLAQRKKQ